MEAVFIYMMANMPKGVLYTGPTTNLLKRVEDHKSKVAKGFTEKYNCTTLVYYEMHQSLEAAAQRERLLKKYRRELKERLIEEGNPLWHVLYEDLKKKAVI